MKKALTKVLFAMITLVIFAAIIPLSANANTSNKSEVYKVLTQKLKFNSAAACGIMANIERESNFDPTLVIRDSNGLLSGGLCQWNGGRFQNLQNYCKNYGLNYLSIEGQLSYLSWEMNTSSYGYIFDYLFNVPNTADGAYQAGYYWCYHYEIPSNASTKARQRGTMAEENYWPVYGKIDLKTPTLSLKDKKNPYDLDNSISFNWSKSGEDVTRYYLYVAEKTKDGKYDWANAKVGNYNAKTTAKNVAASFLNTGNYAAYVKAYNSLTGQTAKSNYATFSIKCLSHKYKDTVITQPTLTQGGVVKTTCTQCGASTKKSVPALEAENFGSYKPAAMTLGGYNASKILLKWNKIDGVDGYRIYQKVNGKWKSLETIMSGETTSYIVSGLKAGTKYTFCYRPFVISEEKVYWSAVPASTQTATRPDTPNNFKVTLSKGTAKLQWDKVSGVDGYAVYLATGKDGKLSLYRKYADDDTLTCNITKLKAGETYRVTVRSYLKTASGYAASRHSQSITFVAK